MENRSAAELLTDVVLVQPEEAIDPGQRAVKDEPMVKTLISSKGQTTIPAKYRARWKSTQVVWEDLPDGSALVRPVPDILSLFGSARSSQLRDPEEKTKARTGWAAQPVKKRK